MSEHENLLQTVKTTLQDIVAPDVRELKVRIEAQRDQIAGLESRMNTRFDAVESRFDAVESRFDAMESRFDAQFGAILAAIAQSKAENELYIVKQIAALSERVASLEAVRH